MKFRKYNSIENSYRQKFLNYITEQGKSGGEWVVTEKVHGANFSFHIDTQNDDLKCGKRSGLIKIDEDFFNYEIIYDKYKKNIFNLYNYLKENLSEKNEDIVIEQFVIYGEIFGGNYPHIDVENDSSVSNVQKEIFYTPNIEFYAFDILLNGDFLDIDYINELFEKFDIFYAKPLLRASLKECLEFDKEYITTIPNRLGLPDIVGNIGEGNVIRPVDNRYLYSGNRVILKNKSDKFSEKKNKKNKKAGKIKEDIKLSKLGEDLHDEISSLVTENRIRNVISHIGKITDKDFGKLMSEVNKDIIEDFFKDYKQEFISLDKKEQKFITKSIGRQNSEIIRKNFINIIDGEF